MNSGFTDAQPWSTSSASRTMTDHIHAEVKSMVASSRLIRKSEGIALVYRYELQMGALLGCGAFSEVHEVRVLKNSGCERGKSYAMKHLKSKLLSESDNFRLAAAELAVEAHMLASFDHPNVIKIRGWAANGVASFTDGRHDSFFLLLDRLDETLDQRIGLWQKKVAEQTTQHGATGSLVSDLWRRLSIAPAPENPALQHRQRIQVQDQQRALESLHLEKLGVCLEIASALAYLHSKSVIFRDLKPNNIGFLHGRVQLFDFGLSRELPSPNLEEPFEMSGKVVS
jgi:serine/threonine protein kinase